MIATSCCSGVVECGCVMQFQLYVISPARRGNKAPSSLLVPRLTLFQNLYYQLGHDVKADDGQVPNLSV